MPLLVSTAAISFALGMLAKYLADVFLEDRVALWGSFAGLQLSHNPGIAFGVRLPAIFQEVLIFCALLFVIVLAVRGARTSISRLGYGLIIGGALCNAVDRLRDGLVTDFFQVGSFPIFNVADSAITVGVVFLLAEIFGLVRSNTK